MAIAIWIAAALLAALNLAAGGLKLARPKSALTMLPWVEDFSAAQVKLIGAAEVLAAIGLIVPKLTGILPFLTPLAAFALAALQVGAVATHVRRKESFAPNLVLIALALFVGVGWLVVG